MLLMDEAKPRQWNMRSKGFFFLGSGQYTIFLYSRPERAKFRLAPWPESLHFLAVVQKKYLPSDLKEKPSMEIVEIWLRDSVGPCRMETEVCVKCELSVSGRNTCTASLALGIRPRLRIAVKSSNNAIMHVCSMRSLSRIFSRFRQF